MENLALRQNQSVQPFRPTLRDAVAPVFRQRRVATFAFLAIFAGALLCALFLPRKYEASMEIFVHRERVDPVVTANPNVQLPLLNAEIPVEALNSEVELLKSQDLLEKVLLACGLDTITNDTAWPTLSKAMKSLRSLLPERRMGEDSRLALAALSMRDRLKVEPLRQTTMIRVSYPSYDPQLAARVLNTLAALYVEKHSAVHRPAGTFEFFQNEADRYQKELAVAEAHLSEFNNRESMVAADLEKPALLQKLSEFEAEYHNIQAQARAADDRIRDLESKASTTPLRRTAAVRTAANPALLEQLKATLLNLELRRTELLAKFEPSYRPVQEIEQQIAQTRAALAAEEQQPVKEETTDNNPTQDWIQTELAKSRADRATLHSQADYLAKVVQAYQGNLRRLDEKGAVQGDLIRDAKTAEQSYLLYVQKREEARIADALDRQRISNVTIAEAASVPPEPTLHMSWILLGGLILASLVGVGSAYAADRMDPSVRTPEELAAVLDVPVLASFPKNHLLT